MRVKNAPYQPQIPSFAPQLPPDEPDLGGLNTAFKALDIDSLDRKINQQLTDFSGLLDTLSSIEDKQKALWKQIYENAVQDRKNAYIMWSDLYSFVHAHPNEHSIHGQNLSRYMERMSKANDQILKLAELVSSATEDEVEETFTEDDMYERIQKTNG
ncbi:MAG: hypothetical protein WC761_00630 [Candidatus Paceibacterota bacterium]|jgi:hypothetical protein